MLIGLYCYLSRLGLLVVLVWFDLRCFDFVSYSVFRLMLPIWGFLRVDSVGVWLFAFWLVCWHVVDVVGFVGLCLLCYCLRWMLRFIVVLC